MEVKNIKIIGLGGIGSILTDKICRFMTFGKFANNDWKITLIDGDSYEQKNRERQDFLYLKNKASSKADELNDKFGENTIFHEIHEYINEDNIGRYIVDGDLVFICVDNDHSRRLISKYAEKTLDNIIIISGGNDYTDGNVQIYIRQNGKDITPSLTSYHPEIESPDDKHPDDMSCDELADSAPQLYFANLTAATIMCWVFYVIISGDFNYIAKSEIYFDIKLMSVISKLRAVY